MDSYCYLANLHFRPIRRLFLGLGMNGAICLAVYNSYWFGITNFGWLQRFVDKVSNPGLVSAGKLLHFLCAFLTYFDWSVRVDNFYPYNPSVIIK